MATEEQIAWGDRADGSMMEPLRCTEIEFQRIGEKQIAQAMRGHIDEAQNPSRLFKRLNVDEEPVRSLIEAMSQLREPLLQMIQKRKVKKERLEFTYRAGLADGIMLGIKMAVATVSHRCEECGKFLSKPEDWTERCQEYVQDAITRLRDAGQDIPDDVSTEVIVLCQECAALEIARATASMN